MIICPGYFPFGLITYLLLGVLDLVWDMLAQLKPSKTSTPKHNDSFKQHIKQKLQPSCLPAKPEMGYPMCWGQTALEPKM